MRVLIAGIGSIGQRHVRNLRSVLGPEADLLAYRVRGRTDVISEQFDIDSTRTVDSSYNLRCFDRIEDALAQSPEAAFICNPTSFHLPTALAAARAGCHLFVEKPLSDRYECVNELIDLVESRRLVAVVGYQMRFHPLLHRARQLIQERRIGTLVSAQVRVGEFLPAAHPYEDYRDTYAARTDLGGGVILSQSHELDYIYWLFGLPRRVFALGGHLSRLEMDAEDAASILFECFVFGRPLPVHLSQDFVQRPPMRTCHIVGDRGTIRFDLLTPAIEMTDADGAIVLREAFPDLQRNELFVRELRHFLDCIRGDDTPLVTLREGAQSLRMALAARRSMATGEVVELR